MSNYSKETQVASSSIASLGEKEAAFNELHQKYLSLIHSVDELRADRDFWQQQYQDAQKEIEDKDTTNVWLREQNETLAADRKHLSDKLEWMEGVLYNPSLDPTKTVALMSTYDDCKTGEWAHIPIWEYAKKVGLCSDAYGGALLKLSDQGIINRDGEAPEATEGKGNKKKWSQKTLYQHSEALMKYPKDIRYVKEDKRSDNGNKGGKNAKPLIECPKCGKAHIKEGKVYSCEDCGEKWESDTQKDANKHTKGKRPELWNYGQADEDAQEIVKEPEFHTHEKTTLFSDESGPTVTPVARPAKYDGPHPPPDRPCFDCQLNNRPKNWRWDESIDNYLCMNDHEKETG